MEFGPYALYPRERLLTRHGRAVEIGGRSFDLLVALVQRSGEVVSKRDLVDRVWPDVIVEDGSLRFHMAALRKILKDGQDGARYISTQVGVGYAFVGSVRVQAPHARPPALSPSPSSYSLPSSPQTPASEDRPQIGRLPRVMPQMIGRDEDLRRLADQLEEPNLLAIVGAAGMGKTTLAIAIGHRVGAQFGGQVRFVDLGALEDAGLVPSAIANALRIPVQADDPIGVILAHLHDQRLLMILDNCEHVIDQVAQMAERIGREAPDVRILATSREPLRVLGERVHWLGPLDFPTGEDALSGPDLMAFPAIQLFVDRARAANGTLGFDDAALRRIAQICGRLEGNALAIELVAVRAATHGIEATAQLIGERFSLAWAGRRTAIARHQTLQAALDWSYGLLPEGERRTLERLSVFLGAFSMDAALAVAVDESEDTLDAVEAAAALDGLIAKSLVALNKAGGPNTHRLPEMTRAYAREKLRAGPPAAEARVSLRHAAYYLELLEDMRAPDGSLSIGLDRMVGQIGNIRSALGACFGDGGNVALGTRLAAASAAAFLNMSLLVECREWCSTALARLPDEQGGSQVELELQAALGLSLMFTRGNSLSVETALLRALDIASRHGEAWKQLILLGRLHICHERIGDFATAHDWARKALDIAEAIGEPEAISVASSLFGISEHLAGNQASARSHLERSVNLAMSSEHWRTIHYGFDHRNRSIIALCRVYWLQGMPDRAARTAEKAVEEANLLGHPTTQCIALIWALPILIGNGDLARAAACLDAFEHIAHVNAFAPYIAAVKGLRANQLIPKGGVAQAIPLLEASLAELRASRYELLTVSFSVSLVRCLRAVGRRREALELGDALIERCRANGEMLYMPEQLRLRAAILHELDLADESGVEALLREALDCAGHQAAPVWELRVATDLARRIGIAGRAEEAHGMLLPIRAAFGDGLSIPDLQEADAVLAALAANAASPRAHTS